MSNWLWSFEKLKKICTFKKPDQAGEVAIKFIDNKDNYLAGEAVRRCGTFV